MLWLSKLFDQNYLDFNSGNHFQFSCLKLQRYNSSSACLIALIVCMYRNYEHVSTKNFFHFTPWMFWLIDTSSWVFISGYRLTLLHAMRYELFDGRRRQFLCRPILRLQEKTETDYCVNSRLRKSICGLRIKPISCDMKMCILALSVAFEAPMKMVDEQKVVFFTGCKKLDDDVDIREIMSHLSHLCSQVCMAFAPVYCYKLFH